MPDDNDDTQEEIITGPFCEHWSHPSDCDARCTCGHTCQPHESDEDRSCIKCDCSKFIDEE